METPSQPAPRLHHRLTWIRNESIGMGNEHLDKTIQAAPHEMWSVESMQISPSNNAKTTANT